MLQQKASVFGHTKLVWLVCLCSNWTFVQICYANTHKVAEARLVCWSVDKRVDLIVPKLEAKIHLKTPNSKRNHQNGTNLSTIVRQTFPDRIDWLGSHSFVCSLYLTKRFHFFHFEFWNSKNWNARWNSVLRGPFCVEIEKRFVYVYVFFFVGNQKDPSFPFLHSRKFLGKFQCEINKILLESYKKNLKKRGKRFGSTSATESIMFAEFVSSCLLLLSFPFFFSKLNDDRILIKQKANLVSVVVVLVVLTNGESMKWSRIKTRQ